ncbi:hypothetical protein E6W39_29105 [Kitasatospora acidiphila]|uniref:DUF5753 domain-containing protein n=1 Tax=Kitasatospora acidiphila TaxID=2567942 RepID=A0A540W945_9ACTN|nr:Scr1 family TA system antitoxin-like transcriptional regulator [Kitasatospora acidiphila]TQF05546.1 hypothetical protein E6W39_29105 [Kitasatospora acidiphila]
MGIATLTDLAPSQENFLALAASARDEKVFESLFIWGDLQTRDYATELFRRGGTSQADVDAAVAARLARRQYMDGTRTYHVVMTESTLLSGFGGREVMNNQLRYLLEAMTTPGLTLGIIPATAEMPVVPGGGFAIINGVRVEFDDYEGHSTATDMAAVRRFNDAFDQLSNVAVFGDDARDLITAVIDAR